MPCYLISVNPTEPFQRLVNAKTKARAIAHVIDGAVSAEVPTPRQLMELGAKGAKIEEADGVAVTE